MVFTKSRARWIQVFLCLAAPAMSGCVYSVADPRGAGAGSCGPPSTQPFQLRWQAVAGGAAYSALLARDGNGSIYAGGERTKESTLTLDATTPPLAPLTTPAALFLASFDQAKKVSWLKSFGAAQNSTVPSPAIDLNSMVGSQHGGVIMGGDYAGTLTIDGTPKTSTPTQDQSASALLDAWVAKLDANGALTWLRSYGTSSYEATVTVAVDANDNILVQTLSPYDNPDFGCPIVSGSNPQFFVTKLDASANCVWSQSFALSDNAPTLTMAYDPIDDSILVGGQVAVGVPLGGSTGVGEVAFIAKLKNGATGTELVGVTTFGVASGQGTRAITSIAVDPCGAIFVAGTFQGGIDLGNDSYPKAGEPDTGMFLAKLNPTQQAPAGELVWHQVISANGTVTPSRITVDGSGNVTLVGNVLAAMAPPATAVDFGPGCSPASGTVGAQDLFIAQYADGANAPTCVLAFRGQYAMSGVQFVNDALVDAYGSVVLSASFREMTLDLLGQTINAGQVYDWSVVVADLAP
jgi:hypothetical protein